MKRRPSLLEPLVWTLLVTGVCLVALLIHPGIPTSHEFLTFGILFALVALAPFLAPDSHEAAPSRHEARIALFFAAALLLAPILFALLSLVSPFIEWGATPSALRPSRRDGRTSPLVIGARVVSGLMVGGIVQVLKPSDLIMWSVALVLCALTFLLVDESLPLVRHFLVYGAGVDKFVALRAVEPMRDLVFLMIGGGLAALWTVNVWLTAAVLLQLLLVHRVAQIPRLEKQAQTDVKTGLWNSRHLDILFRTEIERASRLERPVAVMMADLDLMRNINNRYGHLAGDAVLRGIGEIIRKSIREHDIAARFGGEEFVLVLPETDEIEALSIAERLRASVSAEEFSFAPDVTGIRATMSIGVSTFPADAATARDLLHSADRAVYAAKAQGRNRVVLASHALQESSVPRPLASRLGPIQPGGLPALRAFRHALQGFGLRTSGGERGLTPKLSWVILLIICGLVSGATAILSAEQALPGDSLFPLSAAIENTQLTFAGDEGSKTAFEVDLARTRFKELTALVEMGRDSQVPIAALTFSEAVGRAAQSLMLLREHNPALAESLAYRATFEWNEAIMYLHTLKGKLPPDIESSVALTLAAVNSQVAMIEGTPEPGPINHAPEGLTTALSTPDEGTQSPVDLANGTTADVSTPPADTQLALEGDASTSFPVSSLVLSREEGDGDQPIVSNAAQILLAENELIAYMEPSRFVATPAPTASKTGEDEPTSSKRLGPRCSSRLRCKDSSGPPRKGRSDNTRPEGPDRGHHYAFGRSG